MSLGSGVAAVTPRRATRMPSKLLSEDDILDWMSSEKVDQVLPGERANLAAMSAHRDMVDDLALFTSEGRQAGGIRDMKFVARVRKDRLLAMLAVVPDLLMDKKKFYEWLDRNQKFSAYTRVKGRRK